MMMAVKWGLLILFLLPLIVAVVAEAAAAEEPHHQLGITKVRIKSWHQKEGDASPLIIKQKGNAHNLSTNGKMERLRELRAEVRLLSRQLRKEGKGSGGGKNKVGANGPNKWRRHVRQQLRSIMKRLSRLERQIQSQRKRMREYRKGQWLGDSFNSVTSSTPPPNTNGRRLFGGQGNGHRMRGGKGKGKMTPSSNATVIEIMLPASNLSTPPQRNQQQPGGSGGACKEHNNCRPGHCCHRIPDGFSKCVRYDYKEGAVCQHSCACEAQLHCFRTTADATARCKTASASDHHLGHYENAKETTFFGHPKTT